MFSDRHRAPWFGAFTLLMLLLPAATSAAGNAIVKQPGEVRADPSVQARAVAQAPANEPVEIVDRKGAWYEVKSTSGWRGWMRLAAIKLTSSTQKKSGSSAAGFFEPVASTGVRGLDEASLSRAQPNYAALEQLRKYRSAPSDANRFAAELARTREAQP
jgi:uncharacterized protein YgiM (DUF1202 family)